MAEKKKLHPKLEKYKLCLNLLFLIPFMMFLWTNNIPYLLSLLAYFFIPATIKKLEAIQEPEFADLIKGSKPYLVLFFSLFIISLFL